MVVLLAMAVNLAVAQDTFYPRSADYTTTGDINADNGIFTGDLTVTGAVSATGGVVSEGKYSGNFFIVNPYTLGLGTGACSVDFGRATGDMKGVAGKTRLNDTQTAAGKFAKIGGNLIGNLIASNTSIVAGTSLATQTTAKIGTVLYANEERLNNSLYLLGNIIQTGSTRETGTHWAGYGKINHTLQVAELATFSSVKINTSVVEGSTASATNDTLTAASTSNYFVGAANGQRIILPVVSGNTGLIYTFSLVTGSSGSHLFILDGSGSENINGATTIACATQYASISVKCTGTEWVITGQGHVGTWAPYAGE